MSKNKILVIDDAVTVSRFMKIKLNEKGFNVITASNAKKGVSKAQKEKPDLIITDFVLPDATGGQICSYLRKYSQYNEIPIILISGDKDNFDSKKLKKLPNIFFMSKPFTGPELADKVNDILQRKAEGKLEKKKRKPKPKKIRKPKKAKEPEVDLEKIKDLIFQAFESQTDEFIKAKYSFQVKRIICKAISDAFEKL